MKIIRVAGVIWNGETAITDGHLAFTKGQSEEAQLVQQTAQCLEKTTTTCMPHQTRHKDRGETERRGKKRRREKKRNRNKEDGRVDERRGEGERVEEEKRRDEKRRGEG